MKEASCIEASLYRSEHCSNLAPLKKTNPTTKKQSIICSYKSINRASTYRSIYCSNKETYQEFPTKMVYLYSISCLRYTILAGNPHFIMRHHYTCRPSWSCDPNNMIINEHLKLYNWCCARVKHNPGIPVTSEQQRQDHSWYYSSYLSCINPLAFVFCC